MEQRPVCLSIGGSDSCAGAGIQADLRVFEALDVHGCSAITALTAQNPDHILHIQPSSINQFTAELEAITGYYDVACIKTGMLYDQAHVDALIPFLQGKKVVVDPVLMASSGKLLFDESTAKAAYDMLIPHATLWTPNLDEAAFFLNTDINDAVEAATALVLRYRTPILLKGGHSQDQLLRDIFCDTTGHIAMFTHAKQALKHAAAHGTGCRLASAVAAYICHGNHTEDAIRQAQHWLQHELSQNIE